MSDLVPIFLAVKGINLAGWASPGPNMVAVASVAVPQAQAGTCHALTAALFSTGRVQRVFEHMGRWADRIFGGLFVMMGAVVVWHSLRRV